MSYIGQTLPTDVFGGYTTDTFAGDGSATTFTLSQAPFNEQGLIVVINNVIQQPTTNYTVSGTTLTIVGTAVASGDVIYARHTGVALPIGEANALDLQGQSDKLILDADADTTISADTDDQIDFKAGGTDIFQLTATTATINDGTTITTNDNSDTLTLVSTDADANVGPNLNLYRNSSSPADDDVLGLVIYNGQNDNSETIIYARQVSYIKDASDGTEDGQLSFQTMVGGTIRDRLNINPSEIVLNEDSQDLDFRVETDGNTHMLFVDGGNNRAGFVTTPDLGHVHIRVGDSGASVSQYDALVIEEDDNCGITLLSGTTGAGRIVFGDSGDNDIGVIGYEHGANAMIFVTNTSERMRINSDGQVGIGLTNQDVKFHVAAAVNGQIFKFNNTRTSGGTAGGLVQYNYAPDDSSNHFFYCTDTVANRLFIHSNGNVVNHDNSYGQISDERIKQNITDANSQWNDIKSIKVRNFERKDDVVQYGVGEKVQIGVVAQEVETVSPGLIKEGEPMAEDIKMSSEFGTLYTSDDAETKDGDDAVLYVAEDEEVINGEYEVGDVKIPATHSKKVGDIKSLTGEKVKTVAYSVLYMKSIKALQEAMAKIETLETKVKALEDA